MTYQHGKLLNNLGLTKYNGYSAGRNIINTKLFSTLVKHLFNKDAYLAICDHPDIVLDLNNKPITVTSPYLGYFNHDLSVLNSKETVYVFQEVLNHFRKKKNQEPVTIYMIPDSYHDTRDDADIVTLLFTLPYHTLSDDFDDFKVSNVTSEIVGLNINKFIKSRIGRVNSLVKNVISKDNIQIEQSERNNLFETKDSIDNLVDNFESSENVLINDSRLNWNNVKAIVLHNMYNNRKYLINLKRYVSKVEMSPVKTTFNYPRYYNESNEIMPTQYIDNLKIDLSMHKDPRAWSDFGFVDVLELCGDKAYSYSIDEFMEYLVLNSSDSEYKFAFTTIGYYFEDGYYTELGIFEDDYYLVLDADDIIKIMNVSFNENNKVHPLDLRGVLTIEWNQSKANKIFKQQKKMFKEHGVDFD